MKGADHFMVLKGCRRIRWLLSCRTKMNLKIRLIIKNIAATGGGGADAPPPCLPGGCKVGRAKNLNVNNHF